MPKRAVDATSPHGAAASATYEFWLIGLLKTVRDDRVYVFIPFIRVSTVTPAALSSGALQGGVKVTKSDARESAFEHRLISCLFSDSIKPANHETREA